MNGEQLAKLYRSRSVALENRYNEIQPIHRDIRDYLSPRTAIFKGDKRGQRQDLNIINTNPRFASRTLAAGMQSGVTSPMRPWFRLGLPDIELAQFKPVRVWLHHVEMLMREVLNRSNVYDRLKFVYSNMGDYGTAAMGLDEDEDDLVRARNYPIGTFFIAQSAAGRVNTLYRRAEFTTAQAVDRFGKRVSDNIMAQYDAGNYDQTHEFYQIIEPNRGYKEGSALKIHKRYGSVYYDPNQGDSDKAILSVGGYGDIPFFCPRWEVLGDDEWGHGCGEITLGDAKQLQLQETRTLQAIDKNVNPPMVADASMRNQRTSTLPNSTTYVSGLIGGQNGFRPAYQVNPYIGELDARSQRLEMRIDEGYYKNLFLMISEIADQPNITATQINTMREEKLLMLGPVLERLNDELLDPLIDRLFNIMQAAGMIPPPPPEIEGMPLRVEYISVLAQAQKAMGIGNIERFVGFIGQVGSLQASAGQAPTSVDKLNIDALIEEYADGVAVPPTIVNTADEVAAIQEQRARAEQQMQQQAMAAQAPQAIKDLSQADMGGDNALTRVMEMMGG